MSNIYERLTSRKYLLIIFFTVCVLLLGYFLFLGLNSRNSKNITGDTADTIYTDPISGEVIQKSPNRTKQGDEEKETGLIGSSLLSTKCGMTMYNVQATQKVLSQFTEFKDKAVSVYKDEMTVTQDSDATPTCTFYVGLNGNKYKVLSTMKSLDTADVYMFDKSNSLVFKGSSSDY